jgi:lipopolysaccharide export system protein LptA
MKTLLLLLFAGLCGIALAQTNVPATKPAGRSFSEITSHTGDFNLDPAQVIYRGKVFVDDPEVKLHCELLTLDLPAKGKMKRPNRIQAETNVVVDYTDEKGQTNHLTAEKIVYIYQVENTATNEPSITNETVTCTGSPKVETDDFILTGEPLYWTRTNGQNGRFHADNQHMISKKTLEELQGTNAAGDKLH